mgnify:CR=1 FL=1
MKNYDVIIIGGGAGGLFAAYELIENNNMEKGLKIIEGNIKEDNAIRNLLKKKYYQAAISKIVIEKAANKIIITIKTARPGVLIGKQGAEIDVIKKSVAKICGGKQISVNISEVKKPDADPQLVAEGIATQLEKRVSFRRAMKQAISRSMRSGIKGIKVSIFCRHSKNICYTCKMA